MAPIITSAEIARPPAEVFPYVIDPSSFTEWQHGVVSGHMDGPTTRVGSRCTTVRKIGGREREVNTEDHRIRSAAALGRPRHRRSDPGDRHRHGRTA